MGPPAIQWALGQLGAASGHWLPVFSPLSPLALTASMQCSMTLGCLCRFGQCARHPSIHGPLLVLCQRPGVSSLSFHMEVRKGPVPISPLDSHLIGQHQSLVWVQVRVPAPSWLSLFPGSTRAPLCVLQHRTSGRLIGSEPLAGSGSAFLPSVIYRIAARFA